jgi:hypothetical protein
MKIVKADLGLNHEIALCGDFHEGSAMQDVHAIGQTIDYIRNVREAYAVLMGDYCEAKTVDHPHYQREVQESTVMEQYQIMREKLSLISNKVIVALEGNHDWRLSRKIGNTVKTLLCDPLKMEFGGYSSVIWICDGLRVLYKIYATHGFGSINSRIDDPDERRHSMERALKRKLFLKFGDALIMASGHNHRIVVKPPSSSLELKTEEKKTGERNRIHAKSFYSDEVSDVSNGYILPSNRWYVSTGGYLRLFAENEEITGYQEVAGLDPLEIGFAKVIYRDGKIKVERVVLG